MSGFRRSLTIALAVLTASLFPAAAGAQDPGTAEWQQVPRDRMVAECGMDPDVLDAAAPKFEHTPFVVHHRAAAVRDRRRALVHHVAGGLRLAVDRDAADLLVEVDELVR